MALELTADLTEVFRTIVDVESVSGNEAALADMIEQALRGYPHLIVHRDGDAVVARTELGRAKRVIIAGHIDTVVVAGNLPSHLDQRADGTHLVGRGTVDMKGGVAVALHLAAQLRNPRHDLTWIFYDNEEVDEARNGLKRLIETTPDLVAGDFAILMEPTNAEVEGGCQGSIRIRITLEGKAAHSARSWTGINAIHRLADVLARLNAWEPRQINVDGLTYREGLNAVTISGGVATNVIPPEAAIEINYRYAPDKTPEQALEELGRVFDGYSYEVTDLCAAARPGLEDPLIGQFIDAVGSVPRPKYGWTDVARLSQLGIPAINYGPGDSLLAHTAEEHCPVEHLDRCATALRNWLEEN